MLRRLSVFWSAGGLVATALVALSTVHGVSAAEADSFEDWATVSTGAAYTCGVRKNGKLYCWGSDNDGQVGDGDDDTPDTSPRRIGVFEDWATVSAGAFHTCGVRKNGKLYCWGYDYYGQVGDGDASAANAPRRIGVFEDWATVSAGQHHTCGVRTNGKLYCWGSNEYGERGDGDNPVFATAPRRIGTFQDWVTVDAGDGFTCGIRANGELNCWGYDGYGGVGDGGANSNINAPERIGTFGDWADVSAGSGYTCGVRRNGKLYCWGDDGYGQIGDDENPVAATSPRRIGAFEDWSDVAAGGGHTCGVRKNGKLYCWGKDGSGQIGDGEGESTPVVVPRRIGTFEDWANAAAGLHHTCGVRRNGKLYCWGYDNSGQIGDGSGSSADVNSPKRI